MGMSIEVGMVAVPAASGCSGRGSAVLLDVAHTEDHPRVGVHVPHFRAATPIDRQLRTYDVAGPLRG